MFPSRQLFADMFLDLCCLSLCELGVHFGCMLSSADPDRDAVVWGSAAEVEPADPLLLALHGATVAQRLSSSAEVRQQAIGAPQLRISRRAEGKLGVSKPSEWDHEVCEKFLT